MEVNKNKTEGKQEPNPELQSENKEKQNGYKKEKMKED